MEKLYAFIEKGDMINYDVIFNGKYCKDNKDETCTLDERVYTKLILEEDYTYNGDDCRTDSKTCNSLRKNSKVEKGTLYTTNIGGNISWYNADAECKKINENLKVASVAELQKMYDEGKLKCTDGSLNCNFWASEETVNGSTGINYTARQNYTYSTDKSYSSDVKQVICTGK